MSLNKQSAMVMNSMHTPQRKLRIGFIHPDLGIGGAEKLVVDAAISMQNLGHEVVIFTSHHDRRHCFEATRDGTLKVQVMKTAVPRSFLGTLHLPCAILQQLSLAFQLIIAITVFKYPGTLPHFLSSRMTSSPPIPAFDLFFVDQLPICIPILKIILATRIIYYCHFPDKEIGNTIAMQKALARGESGPSVFRKLYRIPLDLLEEGTTGYADKILVNSEFTSAQFVKSFFRLRRQPRVVYPGVEFEQFQANKVVEEVEKLRLAAEDMGDPMQGSIAGFCKDESRTTLVSINRFEAKKNIALALEAFATAQKEYVIQDHDGSAQRMRLVIVGGYDHRVQDNIETLKELQKQASDFGLKWVTLSYHRQAYEPPVSAPPSEELVSTSVVFLPSLPGPLIRTLLLNPSTKVLLYTPTEEHFGIVPLEAMACGVPVLAANSGGPVETIVDIALDEPGAEGTGLLRQPSAPVWAASILAILNLSEDQRAQIAKASRRRIRDNFSTETMSRALEKACYDAYELGPVRGDEGLYQWGSSIAIFIVMATLFFINVYFSHDKWIAHITAELERERQKTPAKPSSSAANA